MNKKPVKIRRTDLLVLWARAAGICSHPDCAERLMVEPVGARRAAAVGEVAHIVARAVRGPRGDASFKKEYLDRYENLILLCRLHHGLIDKLPDSYPPEKLQGWKAEHEAWVRAATGSAAGGVAWKAVVQDPEGQIDWQGVREAVGPRDRVSGFEEVRGSVEEEREKIERLLDSTSADERRFAVFSLGPIPNAVQLGYLMSDRVKVKLFQYHRDRGTWAWPDEEEAGAAGEGDGLEVREVKRGGAREGVLRVSLSAEVPASAADGAAVDVEIATREPSVRWLKRPGQLTELERAYERALQKLRGCGRIHLYYAGPAPGAIAFGRAYNPRMNPPLVVYRYWRPVYQAEVVLNEA